MAKGVQYASQQQGGSQWSTRRRTSWLPAARTAGVQRPSWDVVKVWNGHRGSVPSVGVYHVGLQKQRLSGQQSSIHPFGGRPGGLIGGGPSVLPLSRQRLRRIRTALMDAHAAR